MYIKLMIPEYRLRGFFAGLGQFFVKEQDEVHYIGGAEVLPPPLAAEEETA